MTAAPSDIERVEDVIRFIECGKSTPRCDTVELCGTCIRRLNPKEFRQSILELLETWMDGRPDIDVKEMTSLCPAIEAMIRTKSEK
ncbi:MAG TPA: hypothetical protein VLU73_14005 [Methylococcaceae bacterium]|nr:hypothetical protein [Methylococcaceae bacterium]